MNWQKKKIERSIKYQTRVFNEHINELVITRRNGKVITVNDGREMIESLCHALILIDRNLKPKKIKKTPKNGCLFNTACVP